MNKKETFELVRRCLYDENLSKDIKKIMLNLYSKHSKLEKIQKNIKISKSNKTLNDLENQIYCINDKNLTDIEKIKLESAYYFQNIQQTKEITSRLQIVSNLITNLEHNKNITDKELLKIKQKIVEIQILSNDEITFYEAAYQLFEDYCCEIEEVKKR